MARKERKVIGIVRSTLGEVLAHSQRTGSIPFLSLDSMGRDRIKALAPHEPFCVMVTRENGKVTRYRKHQPVYLLESDAVAHGYPFMRPLGPE